MKTRLLIIVALAAMGTTAAGASWRSYAGTPSNAAGWPGVRVADEDGKVVAVISFTTPNASFSVPYIKMEETMEDADLTAWNEFVKDANPVVAKRLLGASSALNVSTLLIYDYVTDVAWEKLGGNAGLVNHQVRIVVGYLEGEKWKSFEVKDYQVDPNLMGVSFEIGPIKKATPMGPIVWGYWVK